METSLVIFAGVLCALLLLLWIARAIVRSMVTAAAHHARTNVRGYAVCIGLTAVSVFSTFDLTFRNLTREQAADTPWWVWACYFFNPIASGVAVFVAFLQRPPSNNLPPS